MLMSSRRRAAAALRELRVRSSGGLAGRLPQLRQPLELAQVIARHQRPADSHSSTCDASKPAETDGLEAGGWHRLLRVATNMPSMLRRWSARL